MSLSLIMRISAGYTGLWVLMMALTPAMVAGDLFGVELTAPLHAQMQFTATAAAAVASIQWMVPTWALWWHLCELELHAWDLCWNNG